MLNTKVQFDTEEFDTDNAYDNLLIIDLHPQ